MLTIENLHGVYVDAALWDPGNQMLFLSAWGRDTAMQELLGSLVLSESEGGRSSLRLLDEDGDDYATVYRGDKDRLDKLTGRVRTDLFGTMTHAWLYDKLVLTPDTANQRGVLLDREVIDLQDNAALAQRMWALVRATCRLPLLPEWSEPVLRTFEERGWLTRLRGYRMFGVLANLGDETSVGNAVTEIVREFYQPHDASGQRPLARAA